MVFSGVIFGISITKMWGVSSISYTKNSQTFAIMVEQMPVKKPVSLRKNGANCQVMLETELKFHIKPKTLSCSLRLNRHFLKPNVFQNFIPEPQGQHLHLNPKPIEDPKAFVNYCSWKQKSQGTWKRRCWRYSGASGHWSAPHLHRSHLKFLMYFLLSGFKPIWKIWVKLDHFPK